MPTPKDRQPITDVAQIQPINTPDRALVRMVASRQITGPSLISALRQDPEVIQTALQLVKQKPEFAEPNNRQPLSEQEMRRSLPKTLAFLTESRTQTLVDDLEPWQRNLVNSVIEQSKVRLASLPKGRSLSTAELVIRQMSELAATDDSSAERYAQVISYHSLFVRVIDQMEAEQPDLMDDSREEQHRLIDLGQGLLRMRNLGEVELDTQYQPQTSQQEFRGRLAQIKLMAGVAGAEKAYEREVKVMIDELMLDFPGRALEIQKIFGSSIVNADRLHAWTDTQESSFSSRAEQIDFGHSGNG